MAPARVRATARLAEMGPFTTTQLADAWGAHRKNTWNWLQRAMRNGFVDYALDADGVAMEGEQGGTHQPAFYVLTDAFYAFHKHALAVSLEGVAAPSAGSSGTLPPAQSRGSLRRCSAQPLDAATTASPSSGAATSEAAE